jgi:hypothetical protein
VQEIATAWTPNRGAGAKRGLTLGRLEGDLGDGQLLRSGSVALLTALLRPRTWPDAWAATEYPSASVEDFGRIGEQVIGIEAEGPCYLTLRL